MSIVKNIFYSFIFIADDRQGFMAKIVMSAKLLLAFAPIAYTLDLVGLWFTDNKKFVTFFVFMVIINAVLGMWKHKKENDFNWEVFFIKTGKMLAVVIAIYVILSMLSGIVDETVSKYFDMTIQVMTLFYPGSKAIKSVFNISNGDYPPKWIMKKVYNFEEEGDITELFKKPTKANQDEQ